jgi:hypothetical protein
MPHAGGGGYVFIDAAYVAVTVGYFAGSGKWSAANPDPAFPQPAELARSSLRVGLYVKYPIAVTPQKNIKLSPLAGIEYEMANSGKLTLENGHEIPFDGGYEELAPGIGGYERPNKNDLSAVRANFGCGADIDINRKIFLRGELMYGVRTDNQFERDYIEDDEEGQTKLGHGVTLRIGAGVRF